MINAQTKETGRQEQVVCRLEALIVNYTATQRQAAACYLATRQQAAAHYLATRHQVLSITSRQYIVTHPALGAGNEICRR